VIALSSSVTDAVTSRPADSNLPFLEGGPKQHFVGGHWSPSVSGEVFATDNPSTGEVIAELAKGDADDIDRAVAAARKAFEGPWRTMPAAERQRLMWAFADEIQRNYEEIRLLEAVDMGAPVGPCPAAYAAGSVEVLRYYAGWTTKIHGGTIPNGIANMFTYTLREPVGVVGAIISWNGPLGNALWKIGPALATGCTMVLKPAEQASLVALRLAEMGRDVGLPDGVLNVVTGLGETAGAALAAHRGVDKVSFTGSTATGQKILRAAGGNLKRVSLELGGKSADIVFADADLDKAVPGASMAIFANSGQVCCAGTRLFVERSIFDDFLTGAAEFASTLKIGNSLAPDTVLGPLVSKEQLERVSSYLDLGPQEGARVVTGGARLSGEEHANGYFIPPTLFADVTDDMRVAKEEIFGPVGVVMPFDDVEEVARRANLGEFGLGGGVWTRDVGKAHRIAHGMETGTVWVNTYRKFDPAVPFGGYKMSGWGNELGEAGLDEYLNTKAIWINTD
jgi:aldehyde dehydrogenase (NAD+)